MRSELAAMTFEQWVEKNPPPDLHELVRKYGEYGAVLGEAWAAYDKAYADWQARYRSREWDR